MGILTTMIAICTSEAQMHHKFEQKCLLLGFFNLLWYSITLVDKVAYGLYMMCVDTYWVGFSETLHLLSQGSKVTVR